MLVMIHYHFDTLLFHTTHLCYNFETRISNNNMLSLTLKTAGHERVKELKQVSLRRYLQKKWPKVSVLYYSCYNIMIKGLETA